MKTHSQECAASLTQISTSQFSIVSQCLLQMKNLKRIMEDKVIRQMTKYSS